MLFSKCVCKILINIQTLYACNKNSYGGAIIYRNKILLYIIVVIKLDATNKEMYVKYLFIMHGIYYSKAVKEVVISIVTVMW